jgi:hypothetical protein
LPKRLKRRISELCGLTGLSREKKALKAAEILHDSDFKQKLCNAAPGISHRDIDKVLHEVIGARLPIVEKPIEEEIEEQPRVVVRNGCKMVYLLNQTEVNQLIQASQSEPASIARTMPAKYPTYSKEEVAALIKASQPDN